MQYVQECGRPATGVSPLSSVGRAGASQLQSSDTLIYITRAAKYNMLLRKSKANISFFQSLDPQLISVAGLL